MDNPAIKTATSRAINSDRLDGSDDRTELVPAVSVPQHCAPHPEPETAPQEEQKPYGGQGDTRVG
jgi:hypothetical protein